MRIALCFRGLTGFNKPTTDGESRPLNPRLGFRYHLQSIIQPNLNAGHEIDIFLHSWSIEHKQELLNLYKPKRYLLEEQFQFSTKRKVEDGFLPKDVRREFGIKSFYASGKKVVDLKKDEERKGQFQYDAVMLLRYDVALKPPTKLHIEDYNMKYFYSNQNFRYAFEIPNKNTTHIMDYWFLSNSKYIDQYSEISEVFDSDYNNTPNKNLHRGGLMSSHRIQQHHISKFTNGAQKLLFNSGNLVFVRDVKYA